MNPDATARYLALGDSYTIGEAVDPEHRWPARLTARLRALGIAIADPTIVARTGWTTDELDDALSKAELEPPYALVTLLIGVNNQYRGRDVEEYRREFAALLHRSIEFAGGDASRVIVVSIPDWGVMPFAEGRDRGRIARELDAFNAVNREEAGRAAARWVDVCAIARLAGTRAELVGRDGLHPSGVMYEMWVEVILAEAWGVVGR